ncbi:hypothetical protein [Planotetraspora kaengkrachanensis]|uniref:Uncharacterized protein n=1 Tax=Planotetraspora kaengkrachanensis TaxID=575193 RepID=A0A8J3VC24_9ACTN|nr:hypothetical protein [Planotetraspora kaengkrachanensis]GIG84477.1 hypothetical protein Pka01_76040 [Planotetraspora kaengkrachanensis]
MRELNPVTVVNQYRGVASEHVVGVGVGDGEVVDGWVAPSDRHTSCPASHRDTVATETVYRKQIRPALTKDEQPLRGIVTQFVTQPGKTRSEKVRFAWWAVLGSNQ